MRKPLAIVLLSAVAVTAGLLGAAVPASAALAPPASPAPAAAPSASKFTGEPAAECLTTQDARFSSGRWQRGNPGVLRTTLRGPAGAVLCEEIALNLSWYSLPDTWNGDLEFPAGGTAIPQQLIAHAPDLVFPKGAVVGTTQTADVTDKLRDVCLPYQIDLYSGAKIEVVGSRGHGKYFIAGGIVDPRTNPDCQSTPTTPTTPTTTTSTTPAETTPTTPAETTPTTPAETTPTTPAETTSTTPAGTTSTTPAGTTTTATLPSQTTTVATTAPVATTTSLATTAAPALAFTGVGGTGTLIGLAVALFLGGVGLVVITTATRRTRGARQD